MPGYFIFIFFLGGVGVYLRMPQPHVAVRCWPLLAPCWRFASRPQRMYGSGQEPKKQPKRNFVGGISLPDAFSKQGVLGEYCFGPL